MNPGGRLFVSSGGTALQIRENGGYVNDYYQASVSFLPTVLENLTLDAWATLHSGTTANSVTVNSGAQLWVSSGGTASQIRENGGYVYIVEGAEVSFVPAVIASLELAGQSATLHSGTTANSVLVSSEGALRVFSGAKALQVQEAGGFVESDEGAEVYFVPTSLDCLNLGAFNSATVHSGTTVNSASVGTSGLLRVHSGGTVTQILEDGGCVEILDGAEVSFTPHVIEGLTIGYGSVTLHSGTTGNKLRQEGNAKVEVFSGGIVHSTVVGGYAGNLTIHSGGTANSTFLNASGSLCVLSGGTVNSTFLNASGSLCVLSGGIADSIWVWGSGGTLAVDAGGSALGVSAVSGAVLSLTVASDTIVQGVYGETPFAIDGGGGGGDIQLNDYWNVVVVSGGTAVNATVEGSGCLRVSSGGLAISTTVNSGLRYNNYGTENLLQIYEGGTASATTVNQSGTVYLSGGLAVSTTVNSAGFLRVYSGASAVSTTVSRYGQLTVSRGGVADQVAINNGSLNVFGTATNLVADGEMGVGLLEISVHSGGEVSSVELNANANMEVLGAAYDTTINQRGGMNVGSYGVASKVTVNSGGMLYMSMGGTALEVLENGGYVGGWLPGLGNTSVTFLPNVLGGNVFSSGMATLHSGTTALSTTVKNAQLFVFSGGSADVTTVSAAGRLFVSNGGTAEATAIVSGGSVMVFFNGTANNTIVNLGANLYVSSGGIASEIVENGGYVFVDSSASATFAPHAFSSLVLSYYSLNNAVYRQSASIHSGTTAVSTTIHGGILHVSSGGTANDTSVVYNGDMEVSSGGMANDTVIAYQGWVAVYDGGTVNHTIVDFDGYMNVEAGGVADSTIVDSGGAMDVFLSGTINDTVIQNGGSLGVVAGTANNIIVHSGGEMCVYDGGTVRDLVVSSGGTLQFDYDAPVECALQGKIRLEQGAKILNASAASIDASAATFAIRLEAYDEIASLASFTGVSLEIAVRPEQEMGSYQLATEAESFTGQVVICQNGICFSPLQAGESRRFGDVAYTVEAVDGLLMLKLRDASVAPEISIVVDHTEASTIPPVKVTAHATDDTNGVRLFYSLDGEEFVEYADGVLFETKGTVTFKAIDSDGNETLETCHVNNIAPVIELFGDTLDVMPFSTLTARSEAGLDIYWSVDEENWTKYDGTLTVTANATYYFHVTDEDGNMGTAEITFTNIDNEPPELPAVVQSWNAETGEVVVSVTWNQDNAVCLYAADGSENWQPYSGPLYFSQDAVVCFHTVDAVGNESTVVSHAVVLALPSADVVLSADGNGNAAASWNNDGVAAWADGYDVLLALDGTTKVTSLSVEERGIEMYNAAASSISLAVKPSQVAEWTQASEPVELTSVAADGSKLVMAATNGLADVMFGRADGRWDINYQALHTELGMTAVLDGRNRIEDIYAGSDDASILLLTDDANGDALFVDDIYSLFPEGLDAQSRLAKIDEVRAGQGDDIIDLTSQRFEYIGGGMTVRGGLGDDVIWANRGDNWLFGDAGNDRIVGASGNDVLVGGAGNDALHGGGGNDIFAFGGDWGNDTVEQLADGKVTLWFQDGDDSKWNAATRTYADGANSVQVVGECTNISLKFGSGDDAARFAELGARGAFDEFTSEKIFEEKNKGLLA